MIKRPGGALSGRGKLSNSQLFPVMSTWRDMLQKAYLVPAIVTVAFVVALFGAIGKTWYFWVLAFYLTAAGYFFIYRLCGKTKPWWILAASTVATALILVSPLLRAFIFVFREILPGKISPEAPNPFLVQLFHMFFGAGLMEELLKALPVFACYYIGTRLRSPWRERVGVWEPLDGILLGAASAAGFTLIETMFQYVPGIANKVAAKLGEGAGYYIGLQLLIPRIIGSVCGHMAYSGYFGYFIGLSALKPENRWQILGIGYVSAAALHALWNSSDSLGTWFFVLAGGLSYVFLAAAILKARQISPTRAQNFATQVIAGGGHAAPFSLQIRGGLLPLYLGSQLRDSDVPGLRAQAGNGVIGEVSANPRDPTMLGLKNLSGTSWTVTTSGRTHSLASGQSVRLAIGTSIDFGPAQGKII
jgi:RsiW-degrading membrane proteinase PrsW (M82 family)